ncbi:hypothetical protein IOD13_14430 [Brevibacterium casei]|nr:hypothetical protein [Brevibacterium casei]
MPRRWGAGSANSIPTWTAEFGIVEGAGEPTKQFVAKWVERVDWALGRAPLALDSLVPELKRHRNRPRSLDSIGRRRRSTASSPSTTSSARRARATRSSSSPTRRTPIRSPSPSTSWPLPRVDYAAGFARLQRTEALNAEDGGLVVNGFGNDPAAARAIYDSPEYLWASQVQNSLLSGYSRARGESIGLNDPVLRGAHRPAPRRGRHRAAQPPELAVRAARDAHPHPQGQAGALDR